MFINKRTQGLVKQITDIALDFEDLNSINAAANKSSLAVKAGSKLSQTSLYKKS
jgi:hypothetical protein